MPQLEFRPQIHGPRSKGSKPYGAVKCRAYIHSNKPKVKDAAGTKGKLYKERSMLN